MPTEKTYVRTIVGRSPQQKQKGGNPAMIAAAILPAFMPKIMQLFEPAIDNIMSGLTGSLKGITGNGTRLAGGKKKKFHRR